MKKLFIFLFISPLLLTAQISAKKPELVFDQLLGIWQYGMNTEYEAWTKTGHVYSAKVFSISNGDTTVSENLRIFKKGGKYYFEQTVVLKSANNTAKYQLTAIDEKLMVFENKKAVFPNKIAYEIVPNNELAVVQEGMVQGKIQFVEFAYKMVK